ncbi:MAG: RDD family protein [Sphingobacteriaceae bacterium]|nr:MAG: RDD family protein [Sphingobacteriaceae bacterium]
MDLDITANTFILSPLSTDWEYAGQLPEFFNYFESKGIYLPNSGNLASFWWRLLAYLIDYIILIIILAIIGVVIGLFTAITGSTDYNFDSKETDLLFQLLAVLLLIFYNATFECLSIQGSIGKLICKLVVVDVNGGKISFSTALSRNFAKLLSSMICCLGFLNVLWNIQRQGWHDQIAKTYVVRK